MRMINSQKLPTSLLYLLEGSILLLRVQAISNWAVLDVSHAINLLNTPVFACQ